MKKLTNFEFNWIMIADFLRLIDNIQIQMDLQIKKITFFSSYTGSHHQRHVTRFKAKTTDFLFIFS